MDRPTIIELQDKWPTAGPHCVLRRSSSIHFACIGVAPPQLFTPQANDIKNIHASLWTCPSKKWIDGRQIFLIKAS